MKALKRSLLALAVFVGAAGLSVAVQPPQGGRGQGGGGGPAALVRSKTVIADVKITEEQQGKLKDWSKEFGAKAQEMMKEGMDGIDRQDRKAWAEKMPAIQAKVSAAAYTELATVLKPEQVTRLKQIEVQVAGLRAFNQPDVKAALKVTDDQEAKIKDATDTAMKDGRDLAEEYGVKGFGGRPDDADKAKEFDKKRAAITKETMTKVMGTMSDDQKKAWAKLTGAPIDVTKVQADMAAGFQRKPKDV